MNRLSAIVTVFCFTLSPLGAGNVSAENGDCGIPVGTGNIPTATDAIYILKAATESVTCELCVCDVNNNGTIGAQDALNALRVSIGLDPTLGGFGCRSCDEVDPCDPVHNLELLNAVGHSFGVRANRPNFCALPCDGNGDQVTDIADTKIIFDIIKEECDGPDDGQRFTFDCKEPTVFPIDDSFLNWDHEVLDNCNGFYLSGAGKDITFRYEPMCTDRCVGLCSDHGSLEDCNGTVTDPDCADAQCSTDFDCDTPATCTSNGQACGSCVSGTVCPAQLPTNCINIDKGRTFLDIGSSDAGSQSSGGHNHVIEYLTIEGFYNGIVANGDGNVFRALQFKDQCDDSFSNGRLAAGTLVEGVFETTSSDDLPMNPTLFECGCDKCVQDVGDITSTSSNPSDPDYYNVRYNGVQWNDCTTPYKVSDNPTFPADGRFRIEKSVFVDDTSTPNKKCYGPEVTISGEFELETSIIDNCENGLLLGGHTKAHIKDNTFKNNGRRAIAVIREAEATVRKNLFKDNGGAAQDAINIDAAVGIRAVNSKGESEDENGIPFNFTPELNLGINVQGEKGNNKFEPKNSLGQNNATAVENWLDTDINAIKNCWGELNNDDPPTFIEEHGAGLVIYDPKRPWDGGSCKQTE